MLLEERELERSARMEREENVDGEFGRGRMKWEFPRNAPEVWS